MGPEHGPWSGAEWADEVLGALLFGGDAAQWHPRGRDPLAEPPQAASGLLLTVPRLRSLWV